MIMFENLIIWRHAEAHPASAKGIEQDLARMLSPKGKQQAKRMANWLNDRLPKDTLVISSPAMRAFQTGQALKTELKVFEALSPSASLQQVLGVLADINADERNLLLVGHQPWLWQLVAHLTEFTAREIAIKKGEVWWLRLHIDEAGKAYYNIVAVQSPKFLK